jgi:pyruvate/2-oxoglutarate dehydrogenase complex dihydrolipoamide acyltransferase (E2) component
MTSHSLLHNKNAPTTSPPTVSPFHPPSVIDQAYDDSINADSMSILSHTTINEDMSSHASNLNLITQPNPTFTAQTTTANKRARSNTLQQPQPDEPKYIYLTVPINESFSITHTNLQETLSTASLPPSLLLSPLPAWTTHSATHTDKNLVFVQLHDTSYTNQALRAIRNKIQLSMPQLSSQLPPTTTVDDVDLSPHSSETFQCFCRITKCPKRVGSFGYSTDFLTRRSVRSDIDSVRKL